MPALHAATLSLSHDAAVALPGSVATAAPPAGEDTAMPAELGGVRLRHLLGQGGMGRVYLGRHLALDRDVAVKVLRHQHSEDHDRLLAEARLAARLDHPNIVRILHAGDEQERLFLVMEFVPGRNLKRLLQERGRLPWREAAGFILQAARGLGAAHRAGIIHRDVKPSNMLVCPDGRLKVADLGVARLVDDAHHHTLTGLLVGTPSYMAPEQAQDARCVTPAADVYALGVSLFQLLTGDVPYFRLSFTGVLLAHQKEPIPDIRKQVADLPPPLVALLNRLLAKRPEQRPVDGEAVAVELERILGPGTLSTTAATMTGLDAGVASWWSWWRAAAASLAFSGLALLGWIHLHDSPQPPVPAPATLLAPAALPPVAAAATWQTPTRAVFVIAEHLPVAALAGIDEACRASGLAVVERSRIDTLIREQDLVGDGRVAPATAGRLGQLVGGHIALFVRAVEERCEVRTVLVETGEVVASRLVTSADTAAAVSAGITAAITQLPVQGHTSRAADGRLVVSTGARHGLRLGDRLALRRNLDGTASVTATVTALEREQATLDPGPNQGDCDGMEARRILP